MTHFILRDARRIDVALDDDNRVLTIRVHTDIPCGDVSIETIIVRTVSGLAWNSAPQTIAAIPEEYKITRVYEAQP